MCKKMVVFGYGARGRIYAGYTKDHPEQFELVAIIENQKDRYNKAKSLYPDAKLFYNYKDFLNEKIEADVVVISTQDKDHKEHAIEMMKNGYDLLLEKPIATTYEDCMAIYDASKKYNKKVVVCHVLRYAPFYMKVKNLLDSGIIGKVQTMNLSENIGYYHFAHSFVRGPWRNSDESSCIILAKCCHDLDMICYLLNKKCLSLSSIGSLSYFNKDNTPKICAEYCSECKNNDCVFKAQKIYTTPKMMWMAQYFSVSDDEKQILKDLEKSRYDRCVFKSDNNVCDRQMVIMRFEGETQAVLSLDAFSKDIYRDIKIHGDKGEIVGNVEKSFLELRLFSGEINQIDITKEFDNKGQKGHGGGDYRLMDGLFRFLNGEEVEGITLLDVSIESHKIAFGAEESRKKYGKPVFFD